MDFFTANDAPIAITINGTPYSVPRFLLPEMDAWTAKIQKAAADLATAHLTKDEKARFLTYFQPALMDVADIAQMIRTPAGVKVVLEHCLKAAGVPDDVRKAMLRSGDPVALRNLADQLGSATKALPKTDGEGKQSPLTGAAGESSDSPATGEQTAPSSTQSTQASNEQDSPSTPT